MGRKTQARPPQRSSRIRLLARLGAAPWSEEFYSVPEQRCFVLQRVQAPPTIIRKPRSEVLLSVE